MLEDINRIEKVAFSENNYTGREESQFIVDFEEKSRVVLIAPHNISHVKGNGQPGAPEVYTGSIALYLGRKKNIWTILQARSPISIGDSFSPVFYNELESMMVSGKIYLDIHGAKNDYGFDICLGTGGNISNEQQDIIHIFKNIFKDFNVVVNEPFAANFKNSTPKLAEKVGSVGIQIEIARKLRSNDWLMESFVNTFETFISKIS